MQLINFSCILNFIGQFFDFRLWLLKTKFR